MLELLCVRLGGRKSGGTRDDVDETRAFENLDDEARSGVVIAGMASASEGIENDGLMPPSFWVPTTEDISVVSITGKIVS